MLARLLPEGIIGNAQEIEQGPALCLWLAQWKSPMKLIPFHVRSERTPAGVAIRELPAMPSTMEPGQSVMVLFGDSQSLFVEVFLAELAGNCPGLRVVGGLARGNPKPATGKLLFNEKLVADGAVGAIISGPLPIHTLVSPGCRPIGKPYRITRAEEDVILELEGRPPLGELEQLFRTLNPNEQRLFNRELFIGHAIGEEPGADGQFLTWGMRGVDRATGALALSKRVPSGQFVQFLLADADAADADLHRRLRAELSGGIEPKTSLLFTCNRRGERLFTQPHHDAHVVAAETGNIPVAGFFAEGEIGPVLGKNYCRSHTASVLLLGDG